ncbi:MAG TPA: DNA repair protein RecO [Chromatiaceae bacterium]|nr:DNA repair protein RecO [Chromatiaceae bacterium]
MPGELTPAYILHSRKYGEHHLLVDFLTLSAGRVSLMVRGAASAKSRRRGLLQPFIPLLVSWSGRGGIPNLKQVEQRSRHVLPKNRALFSGFYLNELLVRLIGQNEPVPELFFSYEKALDGLASEKNLEMLLRGFELQLLHSLGYGIDLLHEGQTGKAVVPQAAYDYEPESGLRRVTGESRLLIMGDTLITLAEGRMLDARQSREARELMRQILGHYLGDRPLKSREFFSTLS